MMGSNINWWRLHRIAFFAFIYALVAATALNVFMDKWSFRDGSPRYGLDKMLDYDVNKPWAARILMPWLVNTIYDALPGKTSIAAKLRERSLLFHRYVENRPPLSADPWSQDAYAIKYHIAYCLTFLSLFVLLMLTRLLTRAVYPQNIVAQEIGPILFGLLLPLSFRSGGYIYDFPELVFLFATLLFIWQRRYWPCLLLMPLAALNKESILLWPAICAPVLWFQSAALGHVQQAKRLQTTVLWVVLLTVAILPVYFGVRAHFADRPGEWLEVYWEVRDKVAAVTGAGRELHLFQNLRYWANPRTWLGIEELHAPLIYFPQAQNLVMLLIFSGFVVFRWNSKPAAVRWSLIISTAVSACLVLLIGYQAELRNFGMMLPFFYLATVDSLTLPYRSES